MNFHGAIYTGVLVQGNGRGRFNAMRWSLFLCDVMRGRFNARRWSVTLGAKRIIFICEDTYVPFVWSQLRGTHLCVFHSILCTHSKYRSKSVVAILFKSQHDVDDPTFFWRGRNHGREVWVWKLAESRIQAIISNIVDGIRPHVCHNKCVFRMVDIPTRSELKELISLREYSRANDGWGMFRNDPSNRLFLPS